MSTKAVTRPEVDESLAEPETVGFYVHAVFLASFIVATIIVVIAAVVPMHAVGLVWAISLPVWVVFTTVITVVATRMYREGRRNR